MQYESTLSIKKMLMAMAALLVIAALIQWFVGYLTVGTITITTDSKYNDIRVSSVSDSTTAHKGFFKQSKGSLTTKLKAGGYFVSIQNGVDGSTRYVNVHGHTVTRLNIHLAKTTGVEPVIYAAAQDVIADASRLRYLNPNEGGINQIDSRNQQSEISINYNLLSIKWADTRYGVGQNSGGQLFVIDDGSVRPLSSPISGKDDSGTVFAVAPNRKIYIGLDSSVYAGTEKSGFKKIYSQMPDNSFLSAGPNNVAIITNGYTSNKPHAVIIGSNGKQHSKGFDGPLNGWSTWSRDDRYIVFVEGSKGIVFDSSFHQIAIIPQSNIVYAAWSANGTLFYSIGSQLWSYNMIQQEAHLIANMPLNSYIKAVSVSSDNAYVYLVTQNNNSDNEDQAIRRVGLKSQSVPSYVYQLQAITPIKLSSYALGLINFSSPTTVLVQTYPGKTSGNYVQQAREELRQDGFNPNVFRFQVVLLTP